MAEVEYVSVADALAMHAVLIRKYGGTDGVRDMGALESALFRPQTGYYVDVIAEAAALLESLAMNHPFLDGKKRVAFAVTDTFLRLNGYRIVASSKEVHQAFMRFFDAGTFTFEHLEPWLRGAVRAASGSN